MKVLILDDDRDLLAALKRVLASNNMVVDTCDRAEDALPLAEQGGYDLLLVDYKMPEKDGVWFMRHARLPKTTKVLLITAYVNREVIDRMFELGVSGYLIKPFDEDELLRHIRYHCGKGTRPQ
jgi:DNA-binding response OmpR family regulator